MADTQFVGLLFNGRLFCEENHNRRSHFIEDDVFVFSFVCRALPHSHRPSTDSFTMPAVSSSTHFVMYKLWTSLRFIFITAHPRLHKLCPTGWDWRLKTLQHIECFCHVQQRSAVARRSFTVLFVPVPVILQNALFTNPLRVVHRAVMITYNKSSLSSCVPAEPFVFSSSVRLHLAFHPHLFYSKRWSIRTEDTSMPTYCWPR